MKTQPPTTTSAPSSERSTRIPMGLAALAVLLAAVAVIAPAVSASTVYRTRDRANISVQGGDDVHSFRGAVLERSNEGLSVKFRLRTPTSGSYEYPTADMIPPSEPPHPVVEAGDAEVFTLWAFVFNHPELCSDTCGADDLGDTPAKGGAYQVDATIGYGRRITMTGDVWTTELAFLGAPMTDPMTAEVHLALAPHGAALTGADLTRQLNGPIGNSAFWWTSIFLASE